MKNTNELAEQRKKNIKQSQNYRRSAEAVEQLTHDFSKLTAGNFYVCEEEREFRSTLMSTILFLGLFLPDLILAKSISETPRKVFNTHIRAVNKAIKKLSDPEDKFLAQAFAKAANTAFWIGRAIAIDAECRNGNLSPRKIRCGLKNIEKSGAYAEWSTERIEQEKKNYLNGELNAAADIIEKVEAAGTNLTARLRDRARAWERGAFLSFP